MRRVYPMSDSRRGHNDKAPALTADRHGKLWVAWQSYVPQADRVVARSLSDGQPGPLFEVSDEAGVNFQPTIACDAQDTAWILWSAQRKGHWHILARSIAEDRMEPVVQLSRNVSQECFPHAAADASGRIWAAWTSLRDGRHQIVGRFLDGGRWTQQVLLSHGPGEHFRPAVCADRDGAWLAYETCLEGQYELYLRRWTPARLGTPVRFSLTESWEMFPFLCPDGSGGIWAAWIATHDVRDARGIIDHKVEAMAAHFDGTTWTPWRSPDRTRPLGYVTHLYDGLLGRNSYWGFVGHRRRPQVVREQDGNVWLLYEHKEDEGVNRHGPDALFYAKPLTGPDRDRTFEIDTESYAYTVNGCLPVTAGLLPFAGQIPADERYGDICAGALPLDRTRPVRTRPASHWSGWQPLALPDEPPPESRPAIQVGDKTYRLYWGDTHCHGNCSGDAEGEIDENYAYGRYKSTLDFMAVTDNDFIYDDTLTPSAWALLRAQARHFCDPGRFVTFSGYERTYRRPPPDPSGPNHRTILFADDEQPLCRFTEPDADTLAKWVARIKETNAFEYPHHATWWLAPCSRLGGVELCSSWGVYIHAEDTIPRALRDGFRLAFIGSSDTHRIVPGLGGALTGVWAESLTRQSILEALWARRCFATNGERIALDVRLNGSPMGSEVGAVETVSVRCTVQSSRQIACIDLFRDGECVQRREESKRHISIVLEDRPEPGPHFYHVRVCLERLPREPLPERPGNLQASRGEYAWSSPMWVRVGPKG